MLLLTVIVLFLVTFSTNGALYEECGLVSYAQELIGNGNVAERGEVPWHAGVYSKLTSQPYKQICGGSIISSTIVISAAHCFWDEKEKQLPAANYAVGVGKLYRHWNNNLTKEVEEQQRSDVKEIHLPTHFQGDEANYQDDIAIVIVTSKFKCTSSVRPVCVDFDIFLERQQLQPGNKGTVAGWGLTSENGKSSRVLRVLSMPYIGTRTCINNTPLTYHSHITDDKFCAGYINSSQAVCKGDSGGGLVFPEYVKGQTRYYLRGVASSAPASASGSLCNMNVYTGFTRLQKHEHFIKDVWRNNTNDNEIFCVVEPPKREGCGWSYTRGGQNTVTTSGEVQYGEFPWICAVFWINIYINKNGEVNIKEEFMKNGVLIHPSVVLSGGFLLTNERYKVRAGIRSERNTEGRRQYQLRDVDTVEQAQTLYSCSLLFLTTPMILAPNVAVACLPPPDQWIPPGSNCIATYWSHEENVEFNNEAKLRKVEVSVMEHASCESEIIQVSGYALLYSLRSDYNCVRLTNRSERAVTKRMCEEMRRDSPLFCPIKSKEANNNTSVLQVNPACPWCIRPNTGPASVDQQMSKGEQYVLSGVVWSFYNCDSDPFWRHHYISALRTWIDEKFTAKGYDPKEYTKANN